MTFGNFSRALSEHALDEEPVPEVPVKFLSSGLPARGLEKALGKRLSPVSAVFKMADQSKDPSTVVKQAR